MLKGICSISVRPILFISTIHHTETLMYFQKMKTYNSRFTLHKYIMFSYIIRNTMMIQS